MDPAAELVCSRCSERKAAGSLRRGELRGAVGELGGADCLPAPFNHVLDPELGNAGFLGRDSVLRVPAELVT